MYSVAFCFVAPLLFPLSLQQDVGSYPAQFIVKLLAVVRQEVNWGSEDNCFLQINILSYYDMVWSPWKLQWKFLPNGENHGNWCSTSCVRNSDFKELLLCVRCYGCVTMGADGKKKIKPGQVPKISKTEFNVGVMQRHYWWRNTRKH